MYLIKITFLVILILLELDSNSDIIIHGRAPTITRRRGGRVAGVMEISDELPDGDELVEHGAGDGVEQLLDLLLLVGVLDLVVLKDGEHLVGGAAKHVEGLAAELLLDDAEHGLIGGARLLGLGLVDDVVGEGEHALLALGGGGAAPALAGLVGVGVGPAGGGGGGVALLLLAGLGEAVLEVGGLGLHGAVAEAPLVDPAPERLGLARGLVRVPRPRVGGEHQARVGAVLVLLEPRVRLRAASQVRHLAAAGSTRGSGKARIEAAAAAAARVLEARVLSEGRAGCRYLWVGGRRAELAGAASGAAPAASGGGGGGLGRRRRRRRRREGEGVDLGGKGKRRRGDWIGLGNIG
jgi:hypothetical protein